MPRDLALEFVAAETAARLTPGPGIVLTGTPAAVDRAEMLRDEPVVLVPLEAWKQLQEMWRANGPTLCGIDSDNGGQYDGMEEMAILSAVDVLERVFDEDGEVRCG